MQKFICIGRLTKDVVLNTTNSGISVANFDIAVDRRFKNENGEKTTDFFKCIAFKGLGENIAKFCHKGSKVCVIGELQNRSWEADDGTKRYATEIIVNECEFLDSKKNDEETETAPKEAKTVDEDDTLPF